jgi:hypothetical protein
MTDAITAPTSAPGVNLAHQRLDRFGVKDSRVGRGVGGLLKRIEMLARARDDAMKDNMRLVVRVEALERRLERQNAAHSKLMSLGEIKLSERRRDLYGAIVSFWREHGYAPAIRDLMCRTDYTSTSVVRSNLHKLRDLGLIDFDAGINRSIIVIGAEWRAPED